MGKKGREEKERRRKEKKKKKRKKKRKEETSPDSEESSRSSSPSSSDSGETREKARRRRKEKKRLEALKRKRKLKKKRKKSEEEEGVIGPSMPEGAAAESSKRMAPMTKEEWEARQSVVRRVVDEASGRVRLIRGDGEVLEEIVSRERHKEINKASTVDDGRFFQDRLAKMI